MYENLDLFSNLPMPAAQPTSNTGATQFNPGDWVCLNRHDYSVQLAMESEWTAPAHQRYLQNFSFGKVLEYREFAHTVEPEEPWCHIALLDNIELWLPAEWLYRADKQTINATLVESFVMVSPLLSISSRITVAGQPFDLKIFPLAQDND